MEKRNDTRADDKTAKGKTAPAPMAPTRSARASDNGGRRAQAAMTAAPGERGDGPYGDSEPGTPERHPGV
jgi:hypothetical protein